MKKKHSLSSRQCIAASVVLMFICTSPAIAQVTIGDLTEPNPFSVLEISTAHTKGGLRLPQLVSVERPAIPATAADTLAAEGLSFFNTTTQCVEYFNSKIWVSLCESQKPQWFYMPTAPVDVTTSGYQTVDLWAQYQAQFADVAGNAGKTLIKSDAAAPSPLTKVFDRSELYYYVTGYDDTVFSAFSFGTAGSTDEGKLTFTVNANNASDSTYLNIVFVVK